MDKIIAECVICKKDTTQIPNGEKSFGVFTFECFKCTSCGCNILNFKVDDHDRK